MILGFQIRGIAMIRIKSISTVDGDWLNGINQCEWEISDEELAKTGFDLIAIFDERRAEAERELQEATPGCIVVHYNRQTDDHSSEATSGDCYE